MAKYEDPWGPNGENTRKFNEHLNGVTQMGERGHQKEVKAWKAAGADTGSSSPPCLIVALVGMLGLVAAFAGVHHLLI